MPSDPFSGWEEREALYHIRKRSHETNEGTSNRESQHRPRLLGRSGTQRIEPAARDFPAAGDPDRTEMGTEQTGAQAEDAQDAAASHGDVRMEIETAGQSNHHRSGQGRDAA